MSADPTSRSPHATLQERLLALWRAFDDSPVPGPWVGRTDAFILPTLTAVEARVFTDTVGLEARADLHGIATIDGDKYAWVGVIHRGDAPAGDSDVDRLFDAAGAELATSLHEYVAIVPWLLSPTGITAPARARLLEAGALFSGRADVRNLLEAFDLPADLDD